jgi:uroporphyrinogen decarboxylase
MDCWMTTGTKQKLHSRTGMTFEVFLDRNDVDLRYIDGPRYIGPKSEGDVDLWGVRRTPVELVLEDGAEVISEVYREIVNSPLSGCQTIDEIMDYDHWPSPDWYDYSGIASQCEKIRSEKRIVVFMGDRLNRLAQLKPAMYLRGAEQTLVDMMEQPAMVITLFRKISSFYLEYGQRVLEAAGGMIDIICTGDDFGAQEGALISPAMWEKYLQEGFQKYISLGHTYGARVMHHTCGSVIELLPRLIDCGLDILQSIQPEAAGMNPADLKKNFGAQIAFQGGISIQSILPHGRPAEIRDHVHSLFAAMAPGGGFVAGTSHNIQVDTPVSNIEALYSAFHEFARY